MSIINPYGSLIASLTGQASSPFAVQQADVISLPKDIASTGRSILLKGEVVSSDSNGKTSIKTPQGEITLSLKNPLPVGIKIDIQIPNTQNLKQAIIQPSLQQAIQSQSPATQQPQSSTPNQIFQPTPQTTPINLSTSSVQTQQASVIKDVQTLIATTQKASLQPSQSINPQLNIGQTVRITTLPAIQQTLNLSTLFTPSIMNGSQQSPIISGLIASNITQSQTLKSTTTNIQSQNILSLQATPIVSKAIPISFLPSTLKMLPNLPTNISGTLTPINPTIPNIQGTISTPVPLPLAQLSIPTVSSEIKIPQQPALIKTPIDMVVKSITPPQQILITPPQATSTLQSATGNIQSPSQSMAGDIIAQATGFITNDGNPILFVSTPSGQPQLVSLNYPAKNLPVGTLITLTTGNASSGTSNFIGQPLGSPQNFPAGFQFLVDNFALLFPQSVTNPLNSIFPSISQSKQFPAAALLFLIAAKNGDIGGWLGQKNLKFINDSPSETLKKIMSDMSSTMISMTTKKPTNQDSTQLQLSNDWRGFIIPTNHGFGIFPTHLWVKDTPQDSHKNNDSETSKGTRFIVDVSLSRMGNVHFDGFINKDKKLFDLTLLTHRTLGKNMQQTLTNLWISTLEGLDLNGKIMFREIPT